MQNEIGMMAGALWKALAEKPNQTLAQLKKKVEGDEFMIHAALGWLAREDKVEVVKSGRSFKVHLKGS